MGNFVEKVINEGHKTSGFFFQKGDKEGKTWPLETKIP